MKRTPKRIRKLERLSGHSEGRSSRPQRHPPQNLVRNPAARRRKAARPMQKGRKASPAKPEVLAEASVDSGRVKAALDKLAKAQADLTASGLDLLNVAHDIARAANATLKDELLRSLLQDNLLQDLEQLRGAASATLPPDLQLLPEAVLNWFCRHLEISQHLQQGQELEVPAERLSQYDLQGPPPDPAKALVKLGVLAPGWRHRGQTVIAPRVTIAAPVALASGG